MVKYHIPLKAKTQKMQKSSDMKIKTQEPLLGTNGNNENEIPESEDKKNDMDSPA